MLIKRAITFLLAGSAFLSLAAQENKKNTDELKMEWFEDAKLGIFIHWGVYAVNGISESWSFFNNYLDHDAYMQQLNGFTASQYNPQQWASLIESSGAKYAVITAKHHDGIALWDSEAEKAITTKKHSAAKQDVLSPFVSSLKAKGIKTGIYFSLPDWSNDDYDIFTRTRKRYTLKDSPKRWQRYQSYMLRQLEELSSRYRPDLLWFDGDWEHSAEEWQANKIIANLRKHNPNIIVNARLTGYGDYDTPEQGVPVLKPTNPYWELCYTINDSWGYQPYDRHYKSANMIIRTLIDCISMGGNLLLDIGPRADGSIPAEQIAVLNELGRWTNKNQQAIYGTQAGLPNGHFVGKSTLSKDSKTIYLFLDKKDNKTITVNQLVSHVKAVKILGYSGRVPFQQQHHSLSINIPATGEDKDATVVAIELAEALQLGTPQERAVDYEQVEQSTVDLQSQIQSIVGSISIGYNPFDNSNLKYDAYGYTLPSNPHLQPWIVKHVEALHHTKNGLPEGHYTGLSALSEDKTTLFLFIEGKPTGPIALKGLKNHIQRARIVGEGTLLTPEIYNKLYWSQVPGITYIPVPEDRLDPHMTVIALLLDGPLDLYRENVGAIESNL
ncbi:alpha-L-fucosidase [Olivibacter sp. XZL3]|uniref:alpha-L-fucosidase n=1 Tax=Olivibacter sp. XZL3 TaxID=1735116 RepID=UPI0010664CD0|nr:alpha-L-fucosidase [Olivibacter sp. XZL3]